MSMTIKPILAAGAMLAALPLTAAGADGYRDGWVSAVRGPGLEICYPHGPAPAPAQTVELLRPQIVAMGKSLRQAYAPAGRAKVEAAAGGSCVSAALLDGEARRGDHARAG